MGLMVAATCNAALDECSFFVKAMSLFSVSVHNLFWDMRCKLRLRGVYKGAQRPVWLLRAVLGPGMWMGAPRVWPWELSDPAGVARPLPVGAAPAAGAEPSLIFVVLLRWIACFRFVNYVYIIGTESDKTVNTFSNAQVASQLNKCGDSLLLPHWFLVVRYILSWFLL